MTNHPAPPANSPLWLSLTPQGLLHAFSREEPTEQQLDLQSLLRAAFTVAKEDWLEKSPSRAVVLQQALEQGWVELTSHPNMAPDTRLGDFIEHVIAPLSGGRQAVIASDSGFTLGFVGVDESMADTLSAAAADFASYAKRQAQRGFSAAGHYVSFFSEPLLLLPEWSFVSLWVDGNGYWLILGQEPLLNNQALVELVWGICIVGHKFATPQ